MHMPTLYTNILGTSNYVIKDKTEGLTHADSMLQLPFPGNCMNWILGHLMVYRMQCLGVIDGVSEPGEDELGLYGFGSEPMTDSDKAIPLETLLARLVDLSEQIGAALEKMPDSPAWMRCWTKSMVSPWASGFTSIWSTTRPTTWVSLNPCTSWRSKTVPDRNPSPLTWTAQGQDARGVSLEAWQMKNIYA